MTRPRKPRPMTIGARRTLLTQTLAEVLGEENTRNLNTTLSTPSGHPVASGFYFCPWLDNGLGKTTSMTFTLSDARELLLWIPGKPFARAVVIRDPTDLPRGKPRLDGGYFDFQREGLAHLDAALTDHAVRTMTDEQVRNAAALIDKHLSKAHELIEQIEMGHPLGRELFEDLRANGCYTSSTAAGVTESVFKARDEEEQKITKAKNEAKLTEAKLQAKREGRELF